MALPQNNKIYTYADYKKFDDNIKVEIIEGNIGLKMINEAIHEWAR